MCGCGQCRSVALQAYHYMWDDLPARATHLTERVSRLSAALLNRHESALGHEVPGTFHLPSTQEVLCVGKLVGEEDKIDEQHNVYLEGVSPENDTVHRVKVDLHRLKGWSVFSGQVVALRACNPTGATLQVTEMWTDAALPIATTEQQFVYEDGAARGVCPC